jgi:hypothetical protein
MSALKGKAEVGLRAAKAAFDPERTWAGSQSGDFDEARRFRVSS